MYIQSFIVHPDIKECKSFSRSNMASYKVTYFADIKGGGEIVRLALVVAGQEFEDERLDKETWKTRKSGMILYMSC